MENKFQRGWYVAPSVQISRIRRKFPSTLQVTNLLKWDLFIVIYNWKYVFADKFISNLYKASEIIRFETYQRYFSA